MRLLLSIALITIPITLYENLPLVEVRVGNAPARWFVIDSAAGSSVIDKRFLPKANRDVKLSLDGIALNVPKLGAIDLSSMARTQGHAIDGVLGGDLFERYVVQLDYDTRVMRLFARDSYVPDATADAIPLTIKDHKAYVRCTINDREDLFLIDPGSSGALSHPLFARADVPPNTPPRDLGRAERFRIGRITFEQVNGVAAAAPSFGNEILHRFTVTFDYARSTLYLEPNRHFGDAWMFDMSGLDLAWTDSVIEVQHVFDNTPASESGLRAGDRIFAIDHQLVSRFDLDQIVKMFHQPRVYALDVQRGTKKLNIVMTLRKLL